MAIVYLVDRGDPENADFFAGRSNGFLVWMERSSVESAERTAREFSEVDLYLVERYKDGWVLRSLRSATPFEGHARRIAQQDARMPEAIRNVLSPMSPYRPIVHGRSKNPPLSTSTVNAAMIQDAYHYALAAAGSDLSVFTGRNAEMSRSEYLRAALREARAAGLKLTMLAPAYLKPRLENAANIAKAIRYAAAKHGIEANSGEPHEVTWT